MPCKLPKFHCSKIFEIIDIKVMKEAGRKWQTFIIHFVFRRQRHADFFFSPEKLVKWKEVKIPYMIFTESLGLNQQIYCQNLSAINSFLSTNYKITLQCFRKVHFWKFAVKFKSKVSLPDTYMWVVYQVMTSIS